MSEVAMGISPADVARLFKLMGTLFGHDKLVMKLGDYDDPETCETWSRFLADQPSAKIRRAIEGLQDSRREWPPVLIEFRTMVLDAVARPEQSADVHRALLQAPRARRDSEVVQAGLAALRGLAEKMAVPKPPPAQVQYAFVDHGEGCTCPIEHDPVRGQFVRGTCSYCRGWEDRRQIIGNALAAGRLQYTPPEEGQL